MRKNLIKFSCILLFLFTLLSISTTSHANTIKSIDMDIYIDSSGTANVKEVWKATLNEGSEGYKPYGNMGNCKIENFTVSDDSGRTYETLDYWTVSSGFTEKKYNCGINYKPDGLELCWGISSYGDRTYTLKYKITNFVNQYSNGQGINFFLMPIEMDQNVGSVSLKMSASTKFSEAHSFGIKGTTEVKDGTIFVKTEKKFRSHNYLIVVAKFENSNFPIGNYVSSSFEDDLQDTENYAKKLEWKRILTIIIVCVTLGLSVLFVTFIGGLIYVFTPPALAFEGGNQIPSLKKSDYWREIPCNKDLFKAYWIGIKYNVITDKSGFIGAILLTWVQKGYIEVTKTKAGLFSLKDNNYAIDFTKFPIDKIENSQEKDLADYFIKASGENKILEHKEFEKYCRIHYTTIEKWFDKCISAWTEVFEKDNLITKKPLERKFLFLHKTHSVKTASIQLREEAIRLQGLKKFLLEYSLINEREAIEVKLWEEYLILAELFGIADKVSEQFSKLYPNMNQLSNLNTDFTTLAISNISHSGYHAAHSAYTSSSSGGGHYGGGGSHGGSSGGGFR